MRDLPETDIMTLLQSVVTAHRNQPSATSDAMQVDSTTAAPEGIPSLATFLSLCVSYNYSAPALRLALRKHMPQVEDVVCVLEVLESWISTHENEASGWVTTSPEPASVNEKDHSLSPKLDKVHSSIALR